MTRFAKSRLAASVALLLAGTSGEAVAAGDYALRLLPDNSVEVSRDGHVMRLRGEITVVHADAEPEPDLLASYPDPRDRGANATDTEAYRLPTWRKAGSGSRTDVLFDAGRTDRIVATGATIERGVIHWTFPERADYAVSVTVSPVGGNAEPVIAFDFRAKRGGWYSIGYTGGPATDSDVASGFYQPLVWQEKRFPRAPLLTSEAMGGLPLTLVTANGITTGMAVDPAESPYRMPTTANARFGVMLRNSEGAAQPMAFAPLLGVGESKMEPGTRYAFRVRPVIVRGDWYAAFTHVARALFGFRDLRENGDVSLNATLDNIIDYGMDDVNVYWDKDLKGFSYITDVPGTVKVVSALHPLSIALLRDDPEILRRRALPVTEYLMSREKYLYSTTVSEDGQGASHEMAGPSAEVGELTELYNFSRGQSPVFRHYAEMLASKPRALNLDMVSDGDTFQNHLALYRMGGDPAHLAHARTLADAYVKARIETPQSDFSDARLATGGQFWSDFTPKWVDLFELYEETNEPRYLAAATAGARSYAAYAWYYPAVPPGNVTVDKGGHAVFGWPFGVRKTPMESPERTLPAWRVSNIGLTPEASTTWEQNPAVFLAHYAPYFLRIAKASGDGFLHDVARWAVVGRYANYPGYDINETFSDIYARADYPTRRYEEFSYNQIYYNHVWPQIALLADYLVSDTEMRSGGRIRFPSRYAPGYAYLKSKVYGDRAGEFMGATNVQLWMPRKLVAIADKQLNYLSGRGNGDFYLAINNEAQRAAQADLSLNPEFLPWVPDYPYPVEVWRDGKRSSDRVIVNGRLNVPVSSRGQTALIIKGMPTFVRLQAEYFAKAKGDPGKRSFATTKTPFGDVTGMLIAFGNTLTAGYVWLAASDRDLREARLITSVGDKEVVRTDTRHPFEFDLPLEAGDQTISYTVEVTRNDGTTVRSSRETLSQ